MNRFLYYCGIRLYVWGIRLAAFFGQTKAQKWGQGRLQWQQKLQILLANNQAPILWMHCASLGEFEQGRPVLEALRQQAPKHRLLLTFFSPSGYEAQQNCPQADWVFYLPADLYGQAQQFLDLVQPQQAFFVKYEFWAGYLQELKKRQIPTHLIAANFRPNQVFFRWYGSLFRQLLYCFENIFVQTTASKELLAPLGHPKVIVAGDTRLDRVLAIKAQDRQLSNIAQFCAQAPTLVAGSTWSPDERLLEGWLRAHPKKQLLLVPHEIQEEHLQEILERFSFVKIARYSHLLNNHSFPKPQVLLMDQIGLLSALYGYGTAAYIGGGFGAGIHNCLEAVVYEIPLFFGPNYHKFQEAKALIAAGIATEIQNANDLARGLNKYTPIEERTVLQEKAKAYLEAQKGATAIILQHLVFS
ncbi:MAG: 3-deoxy-D-manno-octulosonic acid transferase [Aureispira sp.]